MSEVAPEQIANPADSAIDNDINGLKIAGIASGAAVIGLAAGAYTTNEHFRPTVKLAQNTTIEPSLSLTEGLTVGFGPLGDVNLPNVPDKVPSSIVESGVRIDITSLDTPLSNPKLSEAYTGLFADYEKLIASPIRDELIERLILGGSAGAAIAASVAVMGTFAFKYKKAHDQNKSLSEEKQQLEQQIAELKGQKINHKVNAHESKAPKHRRWLAKPLATLALFTTLAGCNAAINEFQSNGKPDLPQKPLPADITALHPYVEGGTISGPLRDLPRTIKDGLIEKRKNVDKSLVESAVNFKFAYNKFSSDSEKYRSLRSDPDIKSLLHVADFQCNFAYIKHVFGVVAKDINPDILMNTGDTQANSGAAPYDKECFPAVIDQLGGRPMVNVSGNHDGDFSVPGTITLNRKNRYRTEIQGIHFVGADDPEHTEWSAVPHDKKEDLQRALMSQGEHISKAACDTEEKTGIKPIALAHRWQTLAKAITKGCIVMANNGHLHKEQGVKKYQPAGSDMAVLQHTVGSASGTEDNIPLYDDYAQDASIQEQLYNTRTHTFEGFITYTFKTDGKVIITYKEEPSSIQPATKFHNYLNRYAK